MALETITREEFDRRLEASTEQMRQQRMVLEMQAAELENLINRYASVLERLEVEPEPEAKRKNSLRALLTDLAERTSQVAASL